MVTPGLAIQPFLDAAEPGDTICVRAGTYVGELVASESGTALNPITLRGYPGDARPVIRPTPGLSGSHHAFKIFTASFFNLRGFVLEGAYSDAAGCTAYNIWVSQEGAAHDVEITDNEVRGNTAGSGMLTEASTSRVKILRNTFHDDVDNVNCNGAQAHGMYIQGTNHVVANNLVRDNVDPDGGFGIQLYPTGLGTIAAQNTVTDAPLSCFTLAYQATLVNNICAFNGGFVDGPGAIGCVIANNVRFQSGSSRPSLCSFLGDITGDPRFVNRSGNDYRAQPGGSGVDVADLLFSFSPALDGTIRQVGADHDAGAYETAGFGSQG